MHPEATELKARVRGAVFAAIDEINEQRPPDDRLEKSDATVLFGEAGLLDSLGLVNLIVATEQQLEEQLDLAITLADERAMAQESNPFETVASLVDYATVVASEEAFDR